MRGAASSPVDSAAEEACYAATHAALAEGDVDAKCAQVAALAWPLATPPRAEDVPMEPGTDIVVTALGADARLPGRPERPLLLHPKEVPTRGIGTVSGRAALAHAVAHIEFNAINLALDAVWRFRGLPGAYYVDWLSVARDEALHFRLLRDHLRGLGHDYGDFPAHNGLWEAAEKTAHDPVARMACVPRVLEARGLDVTPGMIRRLREVGDIPFAEILGRILAEEVRHVAVGTYWFRWLCARRGLDPADTFEQLVDANGMGLRPPVNRPARLAAGFEERELALFDRTTRSGAPR